MLKQMIDPQSISEFASWIEKYEKFVIIGHTSPDGDAVGSCMAFYHFLTFKGKKAQVVMPNVFPDFLKWLPGTETVAFYRNAARSPKNVERVEQVIREAEVICCLDFNELSRIDEVGELVQQSDAKILLLDHHLHPADFADITISFPEQSSTCELLFRLLSDLGHYEDMTTAEAACLYTGMMTDTGGFTYNSTRGDIFYIVSLLLDKGINKDVIYRKVNNSFTSARLQLQGAVLSRMTYLPTYHTAILTLSKELQQKLNYHRGDSEGFVNLPLGIKDVIFTCFLREDTERNEIKVSFRSIGNFPCQEVAKTFGGGGHLNAAGAERPGITLKQARQEVITVLEQFKEQLEEAYRAEQRVSYLLRKS
ncbi:MAG: bifunctional oligoribonuclease/PAP phosphatase NrnA [Bacteroidaceae bacterium]|nr:bifunctional oligoribonuclease/PAP phosphatase NrnA [Bacteroidaceae bacterium]